MATFGVQPMQGLIKAIRVQHLSYSRVLVAAYFVMICLPLAYAALGADWVIAIYTPLLIGLLISKRRESNTYATATIWLTSGLSIAVVCLGDQWVFVAWLFAAIAFIATVAIPIQMRMPLVVFYVFYYLLTAKIGASIATLIGVAIIFSLAMGLCAWAWRKTSVPGIWTSVGPPEPPFSPSLAVAILLVVFIPLLAETLSRATAFAYAGMITDALIVCVCAWVIWARDWQKNALAVGALWLTIIGKIIDIVLGVALLSAAWHTAAYYLALAPVMFHTTAPVHRAIRITITLYAITTAVLLTNSPAVAKIIFHSGVFVALLPMAWHWLRSGR